MTREVFKPNKEFSKSARIKNMCEYQALQDAATEDYEGFWGNYAKEKLEWFWIMDYVSIPEVNALE